MKVKMLWLAALLATVFVGLMAAVFLLSGPTYRRTDARLAGESMRVGELYATLVALPRPFQFLGNNRRGENYGVDLFLHDARDLKRREVIAMTERGKDIPLRNYVRILGHDGRRLWLFSHSVFGLNLQTQEKVGVEELARVNPELRGLRALEGKFFKIDEGRLVATVGDGRIFSFDPESLKASPYAEPGPPKPAKDHVEYMKQIELYNEKMSMFGAGPERFFSTGEKLGKRIRLVF